MIRESFVLPSSWQRDSIIRLSAGDATKLLSTWDSSSSMSNESSDNDVVGVQKFFSDVDSDCSGHYSTNNENNDSALVVANTSTSTNNSNSNYANVYSSALPTPEHSNTDPLLPTTSSAAAGTSTASRSTSRGRKRQRASSRQRSTAITGRTPATTVTADDHWVDVTDSSLIPKLYRYYTHPNLPRVKLRH